MKKVVHRSLLTVSSALVALLTFGMVGFADATPDPALSSAMTSAFGQVSANTLGMLAIVVPVAAGILGIWVAIAWAIKLFRKISKTG